MHHRLHSLQLVVVELSNRMSTTILDARMQIAIEGPPLDDEEGLLSAILDDALVRWKAWKDMCRRNVRKSHPGKAGRHPRSPSSMCASRPEAAWHDSKKTRTLPRRQPSNSFRRMRLMTMTKNQTYHHLRGMLALIELIFLHTRSCSQVWHHFSRLRAGR